MKNTPAGFRRLYFLIGSLLALVTLIILLDSLPVPQTVSQRISEDTLLADALTETLSSETAVIATPPMETTTAETETSAVLESETATEETTAPEVVMPPKDPNTTVLTFLGACSPGSPMGTNAYGSLNSVAQNKGTQFFFSKLADILYADDLTVAANACAFTDTAIESSLTCAAEPSQASVYSAAGIDFVSLSAPLFREKTENYRTDTENALKKQSVSISSENTVSYLDVNDIRIALLCTLVEKGFDSSAAIQSVKAAVNEADYVIVYFWSAGTISSTPEDWLRYTLHQFADAGASLIVGVGEGEIRPVEQYQKATIAYSLGSMINGASFGTDDISAMLRLSLKKQEDGTLSSEITMIPCAFTENRWQPAPLPSGELKSQIDAFLAGDSDLPLVNQ